MIRRVKGGPWFRQVPPTHLRTLTDQYGHRPPATMLDNTDGPWLGTSRVLDKAERRRVNKLSWAKAVRFERRLAMASNSIQGEGET